MPVAIVVTPVAFAVALMPMLPVPVVDVPVVDVAVVDVAVVMDAFVVPVAMGVVGVQFSRVGVSSHGNRVRGGVGNGKQQTIVPHSPAGSDNP